MQIRLDSVRLAFPKLITPEAFQGTGDPYYSASLLIPAGSALEARVRDALKKVAVDKWGAKADAIVAEMSADKKGLRSGDTKEYDGYAGQVYLSATAKERPLLMDPLKNRLADATQAPGEGVAGKFYAGCYVNALVEIWAQDNKFGKALRATLKGVQFAKDGDAFAGGAPATESDFDIVEGADAAALA